MRFHTSCTVPLEFHHVYERIECTNPDVGIFMDGDDVVIQFQGIVLVGELEGEPIVDVVHENAVGFSIPDIPGVGRASLAKSRIDGGHDGVCSSFSAVYDTPDFFGLEFGSDAQLPNLIVFRACKCWA